tara:strand:+ start:4736 stop:5419 length:684 start_codon:yes stop_codon:yes gene_type:complete
MNKSIGEYLLNTKIEIDFGNFILALILSAVLSYLIKLTYLSSSKTLSNKKYFSDNFIVLTMVTCLIITIIKFSIALSLGLVGALSIVRFRAAIKEPEELVYLFFCISIGLACGANQFIISIISTIIICLILYLMSKYSKKGINLPNQILNLKINKKDRDILPIINEIKNNFDYMSLKSWFSNNDSDNIYFKVNIEEKNYDDILNNLKKVLNENNIEFSLVSDDNIIE